MGLFKEVYCIACGEKTNMLTRMKLKDGSCLCSKCKDKLPVFMQSYVKDNYSFGDYKNALQWKTDSIRQYKGVFNVTASFKDRIYLDEEHGLFTLEGYLEGYTPVFQIADIDSYQFHFEPKEYKEGVFNGRIEGDLQFYIKMRNPDIEYETVLQYGVKVKVKQKLFGEDEFGDLPEKFTTFERKFLECIDKFGTFDDIDFKLAIVEALSLFMIDNMENVDLEQLIRTRDNLLATFKENPQQVNKINTSYEILADILEQRKNAR